MAKRNKKGTLLKNTVMLYILTFSNYFFGFITVPYQTRVLGAEIYGILGFAAACAVYVQLFLDFGFLLSATGDVSNHRDNKEALSRIMSAVLVGKLILIAASLIAVVAICMTVEKFRQDILLYMLFFLYIAINCLLPDFLYRGLERMSSITYRTVAVKLFFTLAIYVCLRSKEQYYMVPLMNALGAFGACIWTYFDVYKNLHIRFVKVDFGYVWDTLRRSGSYFWSRIASTVYGATNALIIGFLYPAGATVGLYTASEKLMTTARSAFSPIADSMYPYMVANRDYKLVKKIMLILMPIVIVGCAVVGIFAEPFCALMFGEEFRASGELLRLLLPVVVITLPTYVCGFPMLSPLGKAQYANISVIVGAIVHACMLAFLFMTGSLTVTSICVATCITETLVLSIRLFVIVKNRDLMTKDLAQ